MDYSSLLERGSLLLRVQPAYAVNFEFAHPAVVADVQCPSVSRRVAALGRIAHLDFLGGTFPQRQFLLAGILNRSAGIPDDMEAKRKVERIVGDCGRGFVLDDRVRP